MHERFYLIPFAALSYFIHRPTLMIVLVVDDLTARQRLAVALTLPIAVDL